MIYIIDKLKLKLLLKRNKIKTEVKYLLRLHVVIRGTGICWPKRLARYTSAQLCVCIIVVDTTEAIISIIEMKHAAMPNDSHNLLCLFKANFIIASAAGTADRKI